MFKRVNAWRGIIYVSTAFVFLAQTIGAALEANRNVVDGFFGTTSYEIVTDEGSDKLWSTYTADYADTNELVAAHQQMGQELLEEGAVLLKNNGTLPLNGVSTVTLLGIRSSAKTLYGATIGVSVPAEQNISLTTALEESGYIVNKAMNTVYETLAETDAYKDANKLSPSFSGVIEGEEPSYTIAEPTIEEIASVDDNYMTTISEYNDLAIVTVGRPSSEAADYYPGSDGVEGEGARNALSLSDDERAIINFAKENFENVVVLINSSNTMEIGELEEDADIDAILWIGLPGNYGMRGVVSILSGEVNPSGGLPDLYASDTTSSPAMANYGVYTYTNASEYLDTATDRGDYYLIEAEGIYTGYRYYETRYADCVMGQGNASSQVGCFDSVSSWNYDEEVVYPFGYGLSYTDFEYNLEDVTVSVEDKTITANVTVTNTGSVDGKAIVQLYGQAPYIAGGVEKSAIQLVDYVKTETLAAGESVSLTITADLENIASYDEEDSESYILDAGDYYFTVASDSHEAINNVLANQGYTTADGMDAEGNAECVSVWNYAPENGVDTDTFKTTESGGTVENQLDDADYNYWNEGTVTYLSRSDWEGTWPQTYDNIEITEEMVQYLTNDFYEIATDDDTSDIKFNQNNGVTFSNVKGLEYDDPIWDQLLDEIDLQEAILFITDGNRIAPAMDSILFVGGQYTENGPNGFNVTLSTYSNPESPWYVSADDPNANYSTNDMGCAPLVAATFNKEFCYDYGVLWGNDSLYNGLPFIWGPGLNLHRSAYNGRNGEYYSEDPVLTGTIGLAFIQGGLEKGLIMAPKHLAFNDQESNRNGVAPYMTEQKARELELRSFQIAAEGGCLGFMTSFSRIGTTYVGAHTGLLTNILRNEWGFNGYVVSDMVNPATYMTWKESVIAGTTNFDTTEIAEEWNSYITTDSNTFEGDATMLTAIKNNVHQALYAYAQSNAMNGINSSSHKVELNTWWRVLYKTIFAVGIVLVILGIAGYVLSTINLKKSEVKRNEE
ncbi:MAG: glycoside hydrolase family 3 C-terminal domain-containing protein [Butyrivibrio sp.]|nr:glycoside hydrolase family 3 C-terminal domain-containing protein [Butyrivibrio sp.]